MIVLTGIVATIAGSLLVQGVLSSQAASREDQMQAQARLALARMQREIRMVDPGDIITATSSTLSFTDLSGTTVTFTNSGGSLTRNGVALIDDVSMFSFLYYDKNGTTPGTSANIRYVLMVMVLSIDGVNSPSYYATAALRNG